MTVGQADGQISHIGIILGSKVKIGQRSTAYSWWVRILNLDGLDCPDCSFRYLRNPQYYHFQYGPI